MERKMNFVAIGLDGKTMSVENWNNVEVLELLDMLKNMRTDLYGVLEEHFTKHMEEVSENSDMYGMASDKGQSAKPRTKTVVSFNSKLNAKQTEELVGLVNELHIFAHPEIITVEMLTAFFQCETTELKVRNLRLLCALMTALANHEYIGQYWQAPIYRNNLLFSPQKTGYVNRRDLAIANHAINNVVMDYRVEKINQFVRGFRV